MVLALYDPDKKKEQKKRRRLQRRHRSHAVHRALGSLLVESEVSTRLRPTPLALTATRHFAFLGGCCVHRLFSGLAASRILSPIHSPNKQQLLNSSVPLNALRQLLR